MSSRPAIFLSCRVKVFHLQKEQEPYKIDI